MATIASVEIEKPTSNIEFSATFEEVLIGGSKGEVVVYDFPSLVSLSLIVFLDDQSLTLPLLFFCTEANPHDQGDGDGRVRSPDIAIRPTHRHRR